VLAAEYAGHAGLCRAFWFQPADGSPGGYYTEHGEAVARGLVKTPLKYVRVSSAFDRHRFHPVIHAERSHLGVDYAAPVGTPVWAVAAGKVSFIGPRGASGNTVVVLHASGLESTYMHLSRYARGLQTGQTVRQKQVIGYVGATGLTTGPHLHFSLRQNDVYLDPLTYRADREPPLPARYRAEFAEVVGPRLAALASVPTRTAERISRSLP
jgi:murein DD-endopeptidase MepM/ murein hydrolase activator NlpD